MTLHIHDEDDEVCEKCGSELEEVISYYCTGCGIDADQCECERKEESE